MPWAPSHSLQPNTNLLQPPSTSTTTTTPTLGSQRSQTLSQTAALVPVTTGVVLTPLNAGDNVGEDPLPEELYCVWGQRRTLGPACGFDVLGGLFSLERRGQLCCS